MRGGYYCPECGRPQRLGSGAITCAFCGGLGLRGYSRPPQRVRCDQPGCTWSGWNDGINPDRVTHLRAAHGLPQECEWCKGSGRRKSRAKAATNGTIECHACGGEGRR